MARLTKDDESGNDAARGRPTKFRPEFIKIVESLCRLGATDPEIAEALDVALSTIKLWKSKDKDFMAAIKNGKAIADAMVAESLFKRATGYSHEAVKIFNDGGEPLIVPYVEHYPPDTSSMIFWLKNRRPDLWREKREHDQDTNKELTPVHITVEVKDASKASRNDEAES